MDAERRKQLDALGWKSYEHAGDIFGMSEAEKQELDFRIDLANAVKKRRESLGLSQQDLANRLKISKQRVAKIEWGDGEISLEEMLRTYSSLGGRLAIMELPAHSTTGANGSAKPRKKKSRRSA